MSDDPQPTFQPTFKACTQARYDEMLEVLPPLAWIRKGFLVSEPWSHRTCTVTGIPDRPTYKAMVRVVGGPTGPTYAESTSGLTVPEWMALSAVTLKIERTTKQPREITRKPVERVTCGKSGCRGVLRRVTLSRLEEGLGHEGFDCDKCGRRLKYVPTEVTS